MPDSPPPPPHPFRALWISLGLFLLIGVVMLGAVFLVSKRDRFYAAPDEARDWASSSYNKVITPGTIEPIPTLATSPRPTLKVTSPVVDGVVEGSSPRLSIEYTTPRQPPRDQYYEPFTADASGSASLPDGNTLKLTAIALMLPSDVTWGEKRYHQIKPEWLAPLTLQPLSDAETEPWAKEEPVPQANPRLFLRVEKTGTAPLRWQWPEAFDSRTHLKLNSTSSWSSDQTHGQFWTDLENWHQTSLKVICHFAFGTPASERFALEKGHEVSFGTDASLSLIEILPHGHGSSSSGGSDTEFRLGFQPYASPQNSPRRSYIFEVWPPINQYLIDYRPSPDRPFRILSANYGIADAQLYQKDIDATEFELRRLTRLGKVVFDLPAIPRLPEVENLFVAPIPLVRFDYPNELMRTAKNAAGVKERYRHGMPKIDEHHFPMVLENSSPVALIEEYERLTGNRIYFRRDDYELTDVRPGGMIENWKNWWRLNKPGWLP